MSSKAEKSKRGADISKGMSKSFFERVKEANERWNKSDEAKELEKPKWPKSKKKEEKPDTRTPMRKAADSIRAERDKYRK